MPYTKAFIKDAAPVLLSVSFIFLGAQRFYYLKEERVFEYKLLNGKYGVASLIGENNNGLVFYSNENKFIIIPKSSLQTLTPIIDKKSKNMPIENQNFDLEKKNSHIDFHP